METVVFGSLFQFIRNGMNIKQDKSGEGLPITRIETIADATVDSSRVGFAGLTENDCRGWLMEPGDILFSHINSVEHIGKCTVYRGSPDKLVHGMNLLCLRCDETRLVPEFAKYLIRSNSFRSRLSNYVNKAVNQASVSIGNLKSILVSVPALPEQHRIAAILDQADALRAKRREALAQLDSLTQSIFVEMFGDFESSPKPWPIFKLKELVSRQDKINYGVVQPGGEYQNGIPIIRVGDFEGMGINRTALKRIDPRIEAQYVRSRLHGNEVLLSCVGSTIGKVALANNSHKGFNTVRAVARITVGDSLDKIFFAHYLLTSSAQSYFNQETRSVGQPTLNIGAIEEMPIPLPPVCRQLEFSEKSNQIESLKLIYLDSLTELNNFFTSLQHLAFRGEL